MDSVLQNVVEHEVKRHLYIKKFMEYINKKAHRMSFLLGGLNRKKVDIREEYAKFLKHSKLDASDKEFNDEVVDWVTKMTADKKFETTYDKLYEGARKCYGESVNKMEDHFEKRPKMFRPIYLKYFPPKTKDFEM